MKKILLLLVLSILFITNTASAQTPVTAANGFAWEQDDITAANLTQFSFRWVIDNVVQNTPVIQSTVCTVDTDGLGGTCQTLAPAMTPGTHDVAVQVVRVVSGQTLRATSTVLNIEMLISTAPRNLRVVAIAP